MKKEALYYETSKDKIHCLLCPHSCNISNGNSGRCKVRVNENGILYTINYGEVTSIALDPISKKPLRYFKQGSHILSVGSYGCNFTCKFCQNYKISQFKADSQFISKEELLKLIIETENNIGIAFTYNEPSIWYEYVYDCAKYIKGYDKNLSVVLVTNGYLNKAPLEALLPYVDAVNIDLKSWKDSYYRQICGGTLSPVLESIKIASKYCHVEVTTLLVTGENDNLEEVEEIAKYIAEIDPYIPLHLSRYFPKYLMDAPATDIGFMIEAEKIANKYLKRVVLGNI